MANDYTTKLDTRRMKSERESRNLSMAAAGRLAGGMTPQQWEHLENSDGSAINLKTLNKIATALKIPARELLR
jgi:transcriptional regulator with XRE-family HTH domain